MITLPKNHKCKSRDDNYDKQDARRRRAENFLYNIFIPDYHTRSILTGFNGLTANSNCKQRKSNSMANLQPSNLASSNGRSRQSVTASPIGRPVSQLESTTSSGRSSRQLTSSISMRSFQQTPSPIRCSSEVLAKPSAPSIGHLYNNEDQADLVFLVGQDKNNLCRFPGHSEVLLNASRFFKTIISDTNNNNNKEIYIDWCNLSDFESILKYAYKDEVIIKSVSSALSLLYVSIRFEMINLAKECITFLQQQCQPDNVIEVMIFFKKRFPHLLNYVKYDLSDILKELAQRIAHLIEHCFHVIERNASFILKSDEFENLDEDLLIEIVSLDTLSIHSEIEVYNAISNWAEKQCIKQCMKLTDENKRKVLGDIIYCVRYLTMKPNEFITGPNNEGLLTQEDKTQFLAKLNSNEKLDKKLSEKVQQYRMNIPRRYKEEVNEVPFIQKPYYENTRKLTRSLSYEDDKKGKKTVYKKIKHGLSEGLLFLISIID